MKFTVVLSAAVAVTLSAGLALATPIGGDDTGFVPVDKGMSKCSDGVSKNVGTLVGALIKCNIKDSDDKFKNLGNGAAFDGAACQAAARTKWDGKVGPLVCSKPCLDTAGKNYVRDLTSFLVNFNGGNAYCDPTTGTPEDGGQPVQDETGFVPPNKTVQKCEDGAAKLAGKHTTAVGKCHIKQADSLFKNKPFDEEVCENTANSKWDSSAAKLTGCPSCLDTAGLTALRDLVVTLLDGNNKLAYCSPSGAFVQ